MIPRALRLLRLQLLYALLQAPDAILALCGLPRKDIALPFLRVLLELLRALLTLEQALLRLQQSLLGAMIPRALRLLRLQLLYALLQAVDALLTLHALTRKLVALPLLHRLLRLLDALLAVADPLLLRCARDRRGRRARTRRCGDFRRSRARWCSDLRWRTWRHGRTLWRRSRTQRRWGRSRQCRRRRRSRHCRRRR